MPRVSFSLLWKSDPTCCLQNMRSIKKTKKITSIANIITASTCSVSFISHSCKFSFSYVDEKKYLLVFQTLYDEVVRAKNTMKITNVARQ